MTFTDSAIEIRRVAKKWRVPYLGLVRGLDCAEPFDSDGNHRCPSLPSEPCPACGLNPSVVGWDEVHQTLYFAVTTSTSWEKPHQVFRYRLGNKGPQRLTNTWAAGLGEANVTKGGLYLAYLKDHHSAPAAGCAGNAPDVDVVDLWTLKAAHGVFPTPPPPKANQHWASDEVQWSSPTTHTVRLRLIGTDCELVAREPAVHLKASVQDLNFR